MKQVTLTIKLKLVNLNQCKANMLEAMQVENTRLANYLLSVPIKERKKLTTAKVQTDLCSAICNQTIRHSLSKAGQKTKHYKVLPVEVNNQNWQVFKNGETYSISFPTLKGVKRVPISLASVHWQETLDKVLNNQCQKGSIKLIQKRNFWYVYMTVTLEVPEVQSQNRIGCDRGQNNLAVVAPSQGFGKFFSGRGIKHKRNYYQKRRESLQNAKKFRALKKWDKKERRWMESINHAISRRIVRFAEYLDADVVVEDLEGCRQTMKQSKKSRRQAGQSRHSWSFYSLEQKLNYKLDLKGRKLIKVPAPYTSKSCSTCGTLGNRNKHDFNCPHGHYHNADLNAAKNLAQWEGFCCNLNLQQTVSVIDTVGLNHGVFGSPLNSMKAIQLSLF
ncbi:transposase [Aphanothece hegewaldii CCALA 016]|uniref:Transposase n=1 Tax=Aphanothece hegewaldii CCALA 016 TaxID=2107694 RepID=A0A2T1LYT9_9CHRO|nr:RNA-guided endonuclease TnpB family protein [Aphanothece hegewaldii]PSF37499.1 transposase [Aphanothece hegewaldii CCALA 016]